MSSGAAFELKASMHRNRYIQFVFFPQPDLVNCSAVSVKSIIFILLMNPAVGQFREDLGALVHEI